MHLHPLVADRRADPHLGDTLEVTPRVRRFWVEGFGAQTFESLAKKANIIKQVRKWQVQM